MAIVWGSSLWNRLVSWQQMKLSKEEKCSTGLDSTGATGSGKELGWKTVIIGVRSNAVLKLLICEMVHWLYLFFSCRVWGQLGVGHNEQLG